VGFELNEPSSIVGTLIYSIGIELRTLWVDETNSFAKQRIDQRLGLPTQVSVGTAEGLEPARLNDLDEALMTAIDLTQPQSA
jgi:hypothetical protein